MAAANRRWLRRMGFSPARPVGKSTAGHPRTLISDAFVSTYDPMFSDEARALSVAPPIIECRALRKSYDTVEGPPVVALEDIDLAISEGEFVCVVGPSGCGKSTLLKIFAGLLPYTSGTAEL